MMPPKLLKFYKNEQILGSHVNTHTHLQASQGDSLCTRVHAPPPTHTQIPTDSGLVI